MKNYVFDIYGTLIDINTDEYSEKFRARFEKYFCRKLKVKVPFWQRYGVLCTCNPEEEPDFIRIIRTIAEEGGVNPTDEKLMKIARAFRKSSTKFIRAYDGIPQLLQTLKANGAKLYILSNAQSAFTRYELDKLKLTGYFDGIELSSEVGYKKPSQKFFGHILSKYALDPAESIYVGNDIKCDILSSKLAGMSAAYILSDISPAEDSVEEAEKTADFATANLEKLCAYLTQL